MERKVILYAASYLLLEEDSTRGRKKWVSEWVQKRNDLGCYATLMRELRCETPNLYRNFVRMSGEDFDFLERLVLPIIAKKVKHRIQHSDINLIYVMIYHL